MQKQLLAREELLAALANAQTYMSTAEIARELKIGVRDVIHFRYLAGVAPGFIASDGQRYYSATDVRLIRQAFEACPEKDLLLDQHPDSLLAEERELRLIEELGAKRDWASEIASGAVTHIEVELTRGL